jgi:hypothetical protein
MALSLKPSLLECGITVEAANGGSVKDLPAVENLQLVRRKHKQRFGC